MKINLKRIIRNLKGVTVCTAIQESVVNSIQAHATKINIDIKLEEQLINDEVTFQVKSLAVEDDGDGFTKKNRDSFREYGSDTKLHLGCKGIGRMTFLAISDKVEINSHFDNTSVSINFDSKFTEKQVQVQKEKEPFKAKNTVIRFKNIREKEKIANLKKS